MPIVRIELLTGRGPEVKAKIACAFTESLEHIAGIKPEVTTVMFVEVAAHDLAVGGHCVQSRLVNFALNTDWHW